MWINLVIWLNQLQWNKIDSFRSFANNNTSKFNNIYMSINVISKNGILIRLTEERWNHIINNHTELISYKSELLKTIRDPEKILEGNQTELLAIKQIITGKYLVVVYRELVNDGFIITAYLTRRLRSLKKRKQLWP